MTLTPSSGRFETLQETKHTYDNNVIIIIFKLDFILHVKTKFIFILIKNQSHIC